MWDRRSTAGRPLERINFLGQKVKLDFLYFLKQGHHCGYSYTRMMLVFEENVLIKLTKRRNPSANPPILVWAERGRVGQITSSHTNTMNGLRLEGCKCK